jgi:ferric-dicitrate binding protein FerR (iron transport regulator)
VAAAVAACVGLFVIGFARRDRAQDNQSASRVYATTTGQRATLTLSDGSRVTLAPRTTLRIDPAFGRDTRTVALDGEAIFDVASRRAAPFLVRTGAVTTRVLGTTFAVRHYTNDPRVQVAVVEGKVVSGGRAGAITLAAGMVGEISDSTTALRADSAARYVTWTHGQLMFYRAPATELLAALTRWYGYQFHLADSTIAAQNLTAALDVRSPDAAFATLKLLLDVDITF